MKSKAKTSHPPSPVLQLMEPRLLFSATLDVVLVDSQLADQDLLAAAASDVDNYILFDSQNQSAESIIAEVTSWAQQQDQKLDSLSIFSHGSEGSFALGTDTISTGSSTVDQEAVWSQLASVLNEGANIYVMACEAGFGDSGQQLLDELATLTGADVFASDDISGAGGDWALEASSAGSEAELEALVLPFNAEKLANYRASLLQTSFQSPSAVGTISQWVDPLAVTDSDDIRAVSNSGDVQDYRDFNLGISGPGQVVVEGIEVRIETNNVFATPELAISLSWDGGNSWTQARDLIWYAGVGDVVKIAGGSADTWGRTWTADELSDSNFQVRVLNTSFFANEDIKVDQLQVNVSYQQNIPPQAAAGSVTVLEDNSAQINLAATDSGNIERFRIERLPNTNEGVLTLDGQPVTALQFIAKADIDAGLLVFEPEQNWSGVSSFEFSAYDGQDWSTSAATFTVNVTPVNDAPQAVSAPDLLFDEDFSPYTLDLKTLFTDVETGGVDMVYEVMGQQHIAVAVDAQGMATFTSATAHWFGSEALTLRAIDEGGLAAEQTLNVAVSPVNDLPVVSAPTELVLATNFSPFNLDLGNLVSDVETPLSQLQFAVQGEGAIAVSIDESAVATLSLQQPSWTGTQALSIIVTDSQGASAEIKLTINVIETTDLLPAPIVTEEPEPETTVLPEQRDEFGVVDTGQQTGPTQEAGVEDDGQSFNDTTFDNSDVDDAFEDQESSQNAVGENTPAGEENLDSVSRINDSLIPELEDFFAGNDVVSEIIDLSYITNLDDRLDDHRSSAVPVVNTLQSLKQVLLNEFGLGAQVSMAGLSDPWLAESEVYWQELDDIKRQVDRESDANEEITQVVKGAGVMSFGLFGAWFLRAAALGSSMFAVLPMWRSMDPVAVLRAAPTQDDEALEDEAVEKMFDNGGSLKP
jgi:hypothetical protein